MTMSKNPNITPFSTASLPEREFRIALQRLVHASLAPVSLWLAFLYTILAIGYWFVSPEAVRMPIVTGASVTSLLLIGIRIFLQRKGIPPQWSYPLATGIALLVIANGLLNLQLTREIHQTSNLMLALLGSAFFIPHPGWFTLVTSLSLIPWGLTIWPLRETPFLPHYTFGMFSALLLGIIINRTQRYTLRRMEAARWAERHRSHQLEETLLSLHETSQRLRVTQAAVEAAANSILIADRNGVIQWANLAMAHLTGYALDELIGQTPHLFKSGKQTPEFYRWMWKTILAGETWSGEVVNRRKDGSFYTQELTISPVLDENGQITHFIGIAQDITSRKQMQQILLRRTQELQEFNQILASLTSSLDLKTVLSNILEALQRLIPALHGATIQLLSDEENYLSTVTATFPLREGNQQIKFHPGTGAAGIAVSERKPVNIADVSSDPRFIKGGHLVDYRSLLCIPMIFNEKVLGVLSIEGQNPSAFDIEAERLAELFARYASIAVHNAKLFERTLQAERHLQHYANHLEEMVEERTVELRTAQEKLLAQQRLQQEIELAVQVQESLLPKETPQIEGYRFYALALPARQIGGDLYDFIQKEDNCFIVMADISGKGIPAAMFTAAARVLMRHWSSSMRSPAEVLKALNRMLYTDLSQAGMFITFFAANLDVRTGILRYANAGHTAALWYHCILDTFDHLGATTLPIGILPEINVEEQTIHLRPGDLLLFYSDGLTEAHNPRGEFFGIERVRVVLRAHAHDDPSQLFNHLLDEVNHFTEEEPRADDLTLLLVKVMPRTIEFSYPASFNRLDDMSAFIRLNARVYGEEVAYQVELAASELFTNMIRYAYAGREDGEIRGRLTLTEDWFQLEVWDQGMPFDFSSIPNPDLTQIHEGGYGLFIIRQIMDDIEYYPATQQGNYWRLRKRTSTSKGE